ncbi:hypothetical protein HMSSN036_09440 [Paenibacillus macerans]|nr:hypothetical protein HMSSN036_09440 [Paenibacillus macerans]
MARALVNKPDLLVLDEPTVGIDAQTQADFFELIFHMHAHHHMTFLMVSHDIEMIEGRLGSEPRERAARSNFMCAIRMSRIAPSRTCSIR